ncbi:MAG: ActS/PrrB/RegB family redox-sensitive histidine kinase [Alphaproteobacteria bacterium]
MFSYDNSHAMPLNFALQGRVTRRTLILLRWIALAGQTAAIAIAEYQLGMHLPVGPVFALLILSAIFNLTLSFGQSHRRLSHQATTLFLAIDLLQLALVLYWTGGWENPFYFFITTPVAVGAAILPRKHLMVLGLLVVVLAGLLALFYTPIGWPQTGVEFSSAFPALYRPGILVAVLVAALFIASYAYSVAEEGRKIGNALAATQMALAREQRLSALGALAAALVHELGSPLGTMTVVAKELGREVPADSPWADDVALLQSEATRCREILAELSKSPDASRREPFDELPISQLVDLLAKPHRKPNIEFVIIAPEKDHGVEPFLYKSPELVYGLGNFILNAMQFARQQVKLTMEWDENRVAVTVCDDGLGYPPSLLGRLGEPYLSSRGEQPAGSNMGLGIFIAQTLLERTGADIRFSNLPQGGAKVQVVWPRALIDLSQQAT